ncbi:ATP-binding protein [Robinsoniella sp. KNHs210]|uniref:ATP-binding protein n=1 Tax=Robinsoniella sp. KNHs210 TaxID=1469950 RepID=UPI0004801514|nr:ATP-binding protein [Robinsoniella sp. KNHs210]
MNVITEAYLRDIMKENRPEVFYVPEGSLLSPSARDYLNQYKIKIEKQESGTLEKENAEKPAAESPDDMKAAYVDYATGAFFTSKPEHMTQLTGNKLVPKNHLRIIFRGKLDSLQSLIIRNQTAIAKNPRRSKLLEDLEDIMKILQNIMRCDVLDEPFTIERIIGLTHAELREHSHNPGKFYNIRQMILPHYTMGEEYAILNQIRTAIRECEISAINAYQVGNDYTHQDILEEFNRLSSALHIMMCKYLAGEYN